MATRSVLEDDVLAQFRDSGVVRLDGAFSREEAFAISDTVWRHVEQRSNVRLADPSTWPTTGPSIGFKRLRGKAVFAPIVENPSVLGALDAIFGEGGWLPPKAPHAQVLLSFPAPSPWILPGKWHMDCGFEERTWPVPAVKLFSFFDDVEPEGGGTLVLAGSHRLVERYAPTLPPMTGGSAVTWGRFMKQDPWLQQLRRGGTATDPARELLDTEHEVAGIPMRAIELTGRPGDVVITHMHVFHTTASNVTARPRQMLGTAIRAATSSAAD